MKVLMVVLKQNFEVPDSAEIVLAADGHGIGFMLDGELIRPVTAFEVSAADGHNFDISHDHEYEARGIVEGDFERLVEEVL